MQTFQLNIWMSFELLLLVFSLHS